MSAPPSLPVRAAVALACLLAIAWAVAMLERAREPLEVRTLSLDGTPVSVWQPRAMTAGAAPPVVLIAHGFAGSQQLMHTFAVTLARAGMVAITFDFPGHGRHAAPMRGGLSDPPESLRVLLASTERLGRFAGETSRALGGDGRYAVVGHSMASDIVVRHAQAHAEVQATVAVSLFAPSITEQTPADSPRNLLVIDGAWEPEMMAREALRVMARGAGPQAAFERTTGDFAAGTARRATRTPSAEHIGVLYHPHTLAQTRAWLSEAFGRPVPAADAPGLDVRGPWLGLLLLGVIGLAWPLSALLPVLAVPVQPVPARRRWWGWRGQLARVLWPAVLTPLLMWPVPPDLLPLLLGDYLLLHMALYGLLTWLTGMLLDRGAGVGAAAFRAPRPVAGPGPWWISVAAAATYAVLAVGVPVDRYVFNLAPIPVRVPMVALLCAGALLWFWAEERGARDPAAARGTGVAGKAAFLLSLVLAIALNPSRLFFLALIVPAILLLFLVYGLLSRWLFHRTGDPRVAAVAQGLAIGCFIAATFPLVA